MFCSDLKVISLLPDATAERIDLFISEILYVAESVRPRRLDYRLSRDPKDEHVIDLAIGCKADFLITRDNDLLELMTGTDLESKQFRQRFRHLTIVRPDEFLQILLDRELPLGP